MATKQLMVPLLVLASWGCTGTPDRAVGDEDGDADGRSQTDAAGDVLAVGDAADAEVAGDGGGDALVGDGAADDPCAAVGCAAPPTCGESCTAQCGCCGCAPGEGSCAVEAGAYVVYACAAGGSCIERRLCEAGTACDFATPEVPSCAPGFSVGGTLSGAAAPTDLLLSYQIADGSFRVDTLSAHDNGPFVFATVLPDGLSYSVVALWPAGQRCDVVNGTGAILGADVIDVTISCTATSPCAATQIPSPHQCLASLPGCPAYFLWHDLSCNADGSPSPDLACCEPTGE